MPDHMDRNAEQRKFDRAQTLAKYNHERSIQKEAPSQTQQDISSPRLHPHPTQYPGISSRKTTQPIAVTPAIQPSVADYANKFVDPEIKIPKSTATRSDALVVQHGVGRRVVSQNPVINLVRKLFS